MRKINEKADHLIGEGGLSWPVGERHSGRYGAVQLLNTGPMFFDSIPLPTNYNRQVGSLLAEVVSLESKKKLDLVFTEDFVKTEGFVPELGGTYFLAHGVAMVHPARPTELEMIPLTAVPDKPWMDKRVLYSLSLGAKKVKLWFQPDTPGDPALPRKEVVEPASKPARKLAQLKPCRLVIENPHRGAMFAQYEVQSMARYDAGNGEDTEVLRWTGPEDDDQLNGIIGEPFVSLYGRWRPGSRINDTDYVGALHIGDFVDLPSVMCLLKGMGVI